MVYAKINGLQGHPWQMFKGCRQESPNLVPQVPSLWSASNFKVLPNSTRGLHKEYLQGYFCQSYAWTRSSYKHIFSTAVYSTAHFFFSMCRTPCPSSQLRLHYKMVAGSPVDIYQPTTSPSPSLQLPIFSNYPITASADVLGAGPDPLDGKWLTQHNLVKFNSPPYFKITEVDVSMNLSWPQHWSH